MSFDFIGNSNYTSRGFGAPVPNSNIMNGYGIPTQNNNPQQPIQQQQNPRSILDITRQGRPQMSPSQDYETPTIVSNSCFKFTAKDDPSNNKSLDITVDDSDAKRKPRAVKKDLPATTGGSSIVRPSDSDKVSGSIENVPTAYTYMETTAMLHNTLAQIDMVSQELMNEFEMVRANRAMKNKYGILNGLSENIGDLIANKISAIKEINNSISKSNDLDYKRYRDNKEALNQNDDKYISDLYAGFLSNNIQGNSPANLPSMNAGIYGSSGIVRADIGSQQDLGNIQYTNYIANITPEERLMLMEGNNNIRQAMVYDPDTGNRAFQYFDFSDPNHPIPQPGLPVYSDILLDQFTVDLANRKAKSTNLKETMDLIVTNSKNNTY